MLTATREANVFETTATTQNEITVSDREISERVLKIRAGWSVAERIRRRHEAERRFDELIDTLTGAHAA